MGVYKMSKYKIVVCDHIHQSGLDFLQKQSDVEFIDYSHLKKDELLEKLEDADVAITRSSTDVDEKFINAAHKLKAVVRAGVGVDNVDIDACSKKRDYSYECTYCKYNCCS